MKKITINKKFSKPILACGAHLKASFCLGKGKFAYFSNQLGNLEELRNCLEYESRLQEAIKKFNMKPEVLVADLHPDYFSTKLAKNFQQKLNSKHKPILIQHHHAHIASCMAEHKLDSKVIGVAFDGTGFGEDGNVWGGEFLIADCAGFERMAHLDYVPMPGGEAAIRQPWRMAAAYLWNVYGDEFLGLGIEFTKKIDKTKWIVLNKMLTNNFNSPLTSSVGRLFDAVSSLVGLCFVADFEAQAAIELEKIADKNCRDKYKFDISKQADMFIVDPKKIIRSIVEDIKRNETKSFISAKFHNTIAAIINDVCVKLRDKTSINNVVFSGGVFQNKVLLKEACENLKKNNFKVLLHNQIPANDAGISLGQAVIANEVS